MKQRLRLVCRRGGASLLFCWAVSLGAIPSYADTYRDLIKPTLAVVVDMSRPTSSKISITPSGTAFCIWSTPTQSYFLTANHVVLPLRKVGIIAVNRPGKVIPATVVRGQGATSSQDQDPDWAIVSADIGNLPFVKLAPIYPAENTDIEIAGYPVIQIEAWTRCMELGGPGCPSNRDPIPSVDRGIINASTFPPFYIIYDAKTDHGNSGGPLFDKDTGDVYGVVTEVRHAAASIPQVSNNLATSVQIMWKSINVAPVHPKVATVAQAYIQQQAYQPSKNIDDRCELAIQNFSRGFGAWYNTRATFKAIYAAAGTPKVNANPGGLASSATAAVQLETAAVAIMGAAVDDARASQATGTTALVERALSVIRAVSAHDANLSAFLNAEATGKPTRSGLAAAGGSAGYDKSQREIAQVIRELRSAGSCRRSR